MSDIHALSGAYAVDALDDIERAAVRAPPRRVRRLPGRGRRASARPPALLAETAATAPPARAAGPGARRHRAPSGRCRPGRPRAGRTGGAADFVRLALVAAAAAVIAARRRRRRRRRSRGPTTPARPAAQRRRPGARSADDAEEYTQTLDGGARPRVVRSTLAQPGRAGHRGHAAAAGGQGLRALARPRGRRHGARRPDDRPASDEVLLEGDPATALGAGITVEPARRLRGARRCRPVDAVRVRERLMAGTHHRRVAVVGSGVAGLTAAHVAARSAHVTLFEADDRLGGHADTHRVADGDRTLAIDTGFIVHNRRTYPTLLRLFAELGVATQESEMSLSVRDDETGLEWAGALGRRGLFPTAGQPAPAGVPADAHRDPALPPPRRAAADAERSSGADRTLREFLRAGRFSAYFERHFMEPLVAAVWSCDPEVALDYPARYLFTFLEHHGMLGVFGSPTWRTVTGGSHEYVAPASPAGLARRPHRHQGHLGARDRRPGVEVTDGNGAVTTYDAVVVATHPDQALAMLAEPDAAAARGAGRAALLAQLRAAAHRRLAAAARRAAPGRRGTSAAPPTRPAVRGVTVTYDLTRLQRLHTDTHYLVTLGGEDLVDPATVIARLEYEHPLYTPGVGRGPAAGSREIDTDRRRLRRRLPRLGLPRGRRALRPGRRRAARAHVADAAPATSDGLGSPASTTAHAARHLRDHDPPHPAHAVPPHLHPPLAHLAGRPRPPARPRRSLRPVRGARPPRRPGPAAPRQRRGASSPRSGVDLDRRPDADGRARRGRSATASTRSASSGASTADGEQRRRRGRGAQHLRRPARLPRPPRRAGPGAHRQADVRLAVPRHRRPLRAGRAGPAATGSTSPSPSTPTTARAVHRLAVAARPPTSQPAARRPGGAPRRRS